MTTETDARGGHERGTLVWEGNVLRYTVDENKQLRTHWGARDRSRWERDGWTVTPDALLAERPAPTPDDREALVRAYADKLYAAGLRSPRSTFAVIGFKDGLDAR